VLEVPPQDVITRDNVTIQSERGSDTVCGRSEQRGDQGFELYVYQTSQFAQTTLRSVLARWNSMSFCSHRDKLNLKIQTIIDQRTEPFGVKVTSVEVKQG